MMKKILTILFLIVACALRAQYTPNSGAYSYKGLMPLKSLQLPTGCGYPVTSINSPDSSRSAIYFDSCNAALYRFNPKPKTWSLIMDSLNGGITVDSIFITSIDSIFITNTDSIFIVSGNDTIYIGNNGSGMDTAYVRNDTLYGFKNDEEFYITKLGIFIDGLNQPGYVTWSGSGLTFDVTAGIFTIDGITYTGNGGSITLDPADPTFPRFDIIGWDTTGAVIKVTGTAGMNPAVPQVDPNYQFGLTVVSIPAGATTPGGIVQDVIYDENIEGWTGAASGITANLDNTTNPYHLTKSADLGTWAPTPKTLTFTNDTGTIDAANYSILKLFVDLKGAIGGTGNIRISFLNGSTAVSNIVTIGSGVGFNRNTVGSYQNVSIPLSSFTFSSTIFDKIRITFAGTGSGAYIDYIQLQGGITPPIPAGIYQDTTYSRNDSLFGRKNNTEFLAQYIPMASLLQLWGIYINNVDSSYNPRGTTVGIGVDTNKIRQFVTQVINNDTSITNVLDTLNYIVDTVANAPPPGVANGYKALVDTSPTGDFTAHANHVAELVGGVWNFTIPTANQTLEVRNSTQLLFYKYDGITWRLLAISALIGGNSGIFAPDIGTRDSNSFIIKTHNIPAIVVDEAQNIYTPKYSGLEDSSIYYKPGVNGKFDTGYFNRLIAGTGITITPGENRTDTISSTDGGGGSQDLQSVLENGSTADIGIELTTGQGIIITDNEDLVGYASLAVQNPTANGGYLELGNPNGFRGAIYVGDIASNRGYQLPDQNGTLPMSVSINGGTQEVAGADGNINLTVSGSGGTTTNALTFNNSGSGDASGTTFDGSAARTLSYNSIGAMPNLAAPVGYTVHGTGSTLYYDNIVWKDTTKGWVAQNRTTPSALLDVYPMSFPGTVSVTNGSATVTGTSTRFLDQFKNGDSIYINNAVYAKVSTRASNTSLTLTAVYTGTTAGAAPYTNPQTERGVFRLMENGRIYQQSMPVMYNTYGQYYNSGYGFNALSSVTTGGGNSAFGVNAMRLMATGGNNVAIGYGAMDLATSGNSNTALGVSALGNQTSPGSNNFALGIQALFNNTGSQNIGIGNTALFATTGSDNVGIGYLVGQTFTSGARNILMGSQAGLSFTTSSSDNVLIGHFAQRQYPSAKSFNVGIGTEALDSSNTSNNVAVGYRAGRHTRGTYNTFIGYRAALTYSATASSNYDNTIYITDKNGVDSTVSTTSKVGINDNTPDYTLDVNGNFQSKGNLVALTAKTSAYTITGTDDVITGDATGAAFNVTLPTAVGRNGQTYTIKKIDASGNAVTINTTSSQNIDASTTYSLALQWEYVTVISNNTQWLIIANN